MALELKLRITEIESENYSYFTVADANDTLALDKQYGQSGNPARNVLGLFLFVTKKEVGDAIDSIVFDLNSDPKTAATWQVDYNEDNWFEHVLIAGTDWDSGTTYVANDLTCNGLRLWMGVSPVVGSSPGSLSGEWTEITKDNFATAVSNSTGTYDYNVTLNDVRTEISSVAYAKLIAESTKNGICLNCDHSNSERKNLISLHLNAAAVGSEQGMFTEAQYNVVTLKKLTAS